MPLYGVSVDAFATEGTELPGDIVYILGFNPPVYPLRDGIWLILYPRVPPFTHDEMNIFARHGVPVEEYEHC